MAGGPHRATLALAATTIGFAFASGVLLTALRRSTPVSPAWRALDITALAASVLVPLAMTAWPEAAGLLQRGMFAVAYAWYCGEAVAAGR